MKISKVGSQPSTVGPDDWFTGTGRIDPLFDIIESAYYRSASVPKVDRPLWTVRLDGHELVRARIGAGREPLLSNPAVRIESLSGVNLNVRTIVALALPAKLFRKAEL